MCLKLFIAIAIPVTEVVTVWWLKRISATKAVTFSCGASRRPARLRTERSKFRILPSFPSVKVICYTRFAIAKGNIFASVASCVVFLWGAAGARTTWALNSHASLAYVQLLTI